MKNKILILCFIFFCAPLLKAGHAENHNIELSEPYTKKGHSIMQALWERKSTRQFDEDKEINKKTLSNLLWAASGVNRPLEGKLTAPSAMNKQDIEVYACLDTGAYRYDPFQHELEFISKENCRLKNAPVTLFLVAKAAPAEELSPYAYIDAGIVSQNISLFAAGMGLATVPQASMDKESIAKILHLPAGHHLILNHPVGFAKK